MGSPRQLCEGVFLPANFDLRFSDGSMSDFEDNDDVGLLLSQISEKELLDSALFVADEDCEPDIPCGQVVKPQISAESMLGDVVQHAPERLLELLEAE